MFKFKAIMGVEFEAENSSDAWRELDDIIGLLEIEYPYLILTPYSLEHHGKTNIKKEE